MKMQDKVLKAMEDIAKNYDFEFIVNFNHGNTGRAYVMEGFDTDFYISFSFQTSYASIEFRNPDERVFKQFSYLEYHKSKEMNEFIRFYTDVIEESAMAKDEFAEGDIVAQ